MYAIIRSHSSETTWIFGTVMLLLWMPSIIGFLVSVMPLKPAIILSSNGIMLSASSGIYSSLAILQKRFSAHDLLIPWEQIAAFDLFTHYEEKDNGSDGAGGTYIARQETLLITRKNQKERESFSVKEMELSPDAILTHCRQFLERYQGMAAGYQQL
ncbi:hypothetical protein [Chitinophaga solisilvae]|uniref:hypothetical protein n=1 Tax=Chitinophaga solisilvae TaxID=1233460 RepID=UPI001F36D4E7|nr:hypothetical protein [Chitinophaga solisilvae]